MYSTHIIDACKKSYTPSKASPDSQLLLSIKLRHVRLVHMLKEKAHGKPLT